MAQPQFHVDEVVRFGITLVVVKEIVSYRMLNLGLLYKYLVKYHDNSDRPSFFVEEFLLQRLLNDS